MRQLFLVEPLAEPELLAVFADEGPAARTATRSAAVMAGHAIRTDAAGTGIAPFRRPGAEAPGQILAADSALRDRIDYWMTAIGGQPCVAKVRSGASETVVDTYLLPAARATADWTEAAWDGEWRRMVIEAMAEVMRLYPTIERDRINELMLGIGYRALSRARGQADRTPVTLRHGFSVATDLERLRTDVPYVKYFSVEEQWLRHRRYDGAMSGPILRAAFTSGDAVTVLPFDPRTGEVLLIEQFRAGPLARRDPRPWCLETIAGRCDPMETPEETARREAREEAGLDLGRMERIAGYYPSPGMMAEFITAYVGEADLGGMGGTHGLESEGEDIRSMVLPLGQAMDAVASGEVNNAPLLLSLMWLDQHRDRLRAAWT